MRRFLAALLTVLAFAAPAAHAQAPADSPAQPAPILMPQAPGTDPELLAYLSRTPVSLLDWGMMRLERDLRRALEELNLVRGRHGTARHGTLFRFQDRRIVAYVSFSQPESTRTDGTCLDTFQAVREALLAGVPNGKDGAAWYLDRTFGSDVRRDLQRPNNMEDRLVAFVQLEVTLRPPEAEAFTSPRGKVVCAGTLDADTASVLPPPPKPQG